MSRAAPRDRVPDPRPHGPQAIGLALFGLAMRGEARLSDPVACRDALSSGRGAAPGLNDAMLGRLHAIALVQHAARHLAIACNGALDEIERATVAGPAAHPGALLRLSEVLAAALARAAPTGAP